MLTQHAFIHDTRFMGRHTQHTLDTINPFSRRHHTIPISGQDEYVGDVVSPILRVLQCLKHTRGNHHTQTQHLEESRVGKGLTYKTGKGKGQLQCFQLSQATFLLLMVMLLLDPPNFIHTLIPLVFPCSR